jgi:hypothetical protein
VPGWKGHLRFFDCLWIPCTDNSCVLDSVAGATNARTSWWYGRDTDRKEVRP